MKTRDELGARVRTTIRVHLDRFRPDVEVTDESRLLDGGLKLDSLDLVEIAMELEDQLDMEISDDELDAVSTVGELIGHLARKLGLVEVPA
ncbi:MAG: Phosphopantetheine attachment site [Phenylobacterium sp.]|nr:Phosphopantetheine attachment site [Phenylobacterium sp.]